MKEQAISVQEIIDVLSGLIFHVEPNCADATAFRRDAVEAIDRLRKWGGG